MVKLVRKILQNEFRDDTGSSRRSGKRNSKAQQQNQDQREKREEVQLPPGLLQALKATVDEQQSQVSGGGHRSHEERSVGTKQSNKNISSSAKANSMAARSISMPVGKVSDTDLGGSTVALIDSIVKGSDDPALLEALQAMIEESEGDAAYHKETLALVAESIVEKQAAKKALERAAQAETRLQESLKKVAPDLVNDTAAYVESVETATASGNALSPASASWTSAMSTPVHRRIPVLKFAVKNKNAAATAEETRPPEEFGEDEAREDKEQGINERRLTSTAEERREERQEEKPKKRKNKYKDIVHRKPEFPFNQSFDSRDDQSTCADTLEDRDNYTQCSETYCEDEEALQSIQSSKSSSESETETQEEVEDDEPKIEYTLFELESKLSMSACSSVDLSVSTRHSSHDQEDDVISQKEEEMDDDDDDDDDDEEESDSGVGDESDSDDDEENEPFFASFCQRISSEENEEEDEGKTGRKHLYEDRNGQVPSLLKCVSGYFVGGEKEEELEEFDGNHDYEDDATNEDNSARREKRRIRRKDRKLRRKEERGSTRSRRRIHHRRH